MRLAQGFTVLDVASDLGDLQNLSIDVPLRLFGHKDTDWVSYKGPLRTLSEPPPLGMVLRPSWLRPLAVDTEPYVTEPLDSGLHDCELAAGGADQNIYALCMGELQLTLATHFVSSEGVLAISPRVWKFNTGKWDSENPNATGDWRAFFVSNVGASPIDVTEVRLDSETPEDWEVDPNCYSLTPAIGTLQPIEVTAVCIRHARATPGASEAELVVVSTGGTVKSTLIGSASDVDGDGVSDGEEWGPSGTDETFDGNGDGTPDGEQSDVASLHSADGDGYVTIAVTEGGAALEEVTAQPRPKDAGEWRWPWGYYAFQVTGVTGPVQVEMFLHEGSTADAATHYVKHGPIGPDQDPTYYAFEYDESAGTGAALNGDKIVLHFIDGQLGDQDWKEDEVIVDPGGPALEDDAAGGCSCRIADRASLVSNLGLGMLVFGLLIARRSRRKILSL